MGTLPKVGDRVRMVGLMPNDPCPLDVGDEGTVRSIGGRIGGRTQIDVVWDSGRGLLLLDSDPFVVLGPARDARDQGIDPGL